ncbi:ISL3 family transposase [Streptomyces sp. HNM0663]|uniref:ISL3 family transposase n=1 Tax=Streptomyces chengmaiensis TaxID=3040919 RepID=A0ABT6HPX9_9ACTN|nr:ISL3 family transposase [Streptomyces chengmaiensis]MDH2390680.1 ISL3 family transposase [Streptomyces chengmaiensis]
MRATTGSCQCGQSLARVPRRYVRRLRDVAVGGLGAVIELCVRRFRCENPACTAVTFAEQVLGLTTPHSRHIPLLREVLTQIGLALAGRAGARLASAVGLTIGGDTLLRLVRSLPEPETGKVEVVGVDDFAFRKGRHYGTVLIDMATHRPLHLYDGRDGEEAAWLRKHPELKVICRDRSSGYGEGARVGSPQAEQVADRYHLWANLGQAVEKTVNAHRSRLADPPPARTSSHDTPAAEPEVVQPVAASGPWPGSRNGGGAAEQQSGDPQGVGGTLRGGLGPVAGAAARGVLTAASLVVDHHPHPQYVGGQASGQAATGGRSGGAPG